MKNIFYLFLLVLVTGMVSCNDSFLDETVTNDLDYELVFSDSTYTSEFLTGIYEDIGFDTELNRFHNPDIFINSPQGGLHTACDEAQFKVVPTISTDVQFVMGTVNPVTIEDKTWAKPYENIRKVNIFLTSVDKAPLTENTKKTYKAEARFLRAWYYFILLRHYGGIPIIGDDVYMDIEEMSGVRNTFEECVEYIVSECEKAAQDLILIPSGRDHGRIGSGACRGLISRVRLYAASPLFNGSNFAPTGYEKELVGYPEANPERWKLAMDAAAAVMGINGYGLYVDNDEEAGKGFYQIFLASDVPAAYCESILEKKAGNGNGRENLFRPPSFSGSGSAYPYQELVDAFPMKNGKPITDNDSGYDKNNPYANRDPRFYNTIVYDQMELITQNSGFQPVNIAVNANGTSAGQDAFGTGTPTGYYFNKMLKRDLAAGTIHGGPQSRPLIRYAEIMLNYAEARNEYSGPSDEVYHVLKEIRRRGGIEAGDDGMYGLKPNMKQDEMREAIRHERRIELAVEGHRFFDVRRWMIADETENQYMKGMKITRDNDDNRTYEEYPVRQHTFRQAMYLWPIPDSEVSKLPGLVQNPYY